MKIKKSIIQLDKKFPLEVQQQELLPYYDMHKIFHWHECLEISYVKAGYGQYHMKNRCYQMEPGDIIVINNIEPHYLEVYDKQMLQTVLVFNPTLVYSDLSNSLDYNYLQPFLERGSDFNNKLSRDHSFTAKIREQLIAIEEEYQEKPKGYQLMIKARLLMILTYLTRYFRDPEKNNKPNKQNLVRVEKVIEYIYQHYQDTIALKDIAGKLFITPQYFCTIFKETTGYTFNDYVNKIRINQSMIQLKESNKKITHIATECGFNNTTHFNTTFKKFTGKTPSRFRNQR
ncbi:helix-turn-helix transcriptional regulator [Vallitalea pronyensis]|uniref:Helix-turn-helix transcriptional regulator n=1 Tax=Vallitalea pronyensis TaxID=1348613 RepID=A0A8J8MMZ1_9FIRM|nr:AraC family transcriptional regulator [Vallitalea pronyensis]QUI24740.1 helix-turn-helix transcriptional regulator [Vallitalea pronyensis]